jgi:hypothetical protein
MADRIDKGDENPQPARQPAGSAAIPGGFEVGKRAPEQSARQT